MNLNPSNSRPADTKTERVRGVPLTLVALAIATLSGFVDAYAFTRVGTFFVSFMSGNMTQLGVGLTDGAMHVVQMTAMLILAFVTGVMLSAIATHAAGQRHMAAAMGLTTFFLAVAAVAAALHPLLILPLLAAAMGAENGVFARRSDIAIGLTYFTGNLVRMGQGIIDALLGIGPRWTWIRYLASWLAFIGGAVGGAVASTHIGDHALWYATVAAAWLTLLLVPAR